MSMVVMLINGQQKKKKKKYIYDRLHEHFGRSGMHVSMNVNGGHVNKWAANIHDRSY